MSKSELGATGGSGHKGSLSRPQNFEQKSWWPHVFVHSEVHLHVGRQYLTRVRVRT